MSDVEKMNHRPVRKAVEVEAFSDLYAAHKWNHGRRAHVKRTYRRRDRRAASAGLRAQR
jgi:hypothetical protein